jgi:hypothetical protein
VISQSVAKNRAALVLLLVIAAMAPLKGQNGAPGGNPPPALTLTGDGKDPDLNQKPTAAEKKKSALERPVSGVVTDADGKPIVGAVVQLKNLRTLQVRSFITREKGDYFFSGLSKDTDYELKALNKGQFSTPRTLSSFDTKAQPVLNLQVK